MKLKELFWECGLVLTAPKTALELWLPRMTAYCTNSVDSMSLHMINLVLFKRVSEPGTDLGAGSNKVPTAPKVLLLS